MPYETLAAQGRRIKELAISKTIEQAMRGAEGSPAQVEQARGLLTAAVQKRFADVDHVFDDYDDLPDPADFESAAAQAALVMTNLLTDGSSTDPSTGQVYSGDAQLSLTDVTGTGSYLDGWSGEAALPYRKNFAESFVPITTDQLAAASTLHSALQAEGEIWTRARADLGALADGAVSHLEQIGEGGGCGASGWSEVFSVLGAVAGIVTLDLTGPFGLTMLFAIVGAAGGAGGALAGLPNDQPGKEDLPTGSPDAIVQAVYDKLTTINGGIRAGETKIEQAMDHNHAVFSAQLAAAASFDSGASTVRSNLVMPRPRLADHPDLGTHS